MTVEQAKPLLVQVAPALPWVSTNATPLFCRWHMTWGHACIGQQWTHDRWFTLQVKERGGPLFAVSRPLPEPGFSVLFAVGCGGCGCTDGSGCVGGCAWTGQHRTVQLAGLETEVRLPLCSSCLPLTPESP